MRRKRATKPGRGKDHVLAAARPNVGIRVAYRCKLEALIDRMHNSFLYWIKAAYRANPPTMAMDATPAATLQAAVKRLARRWESQFDEAAPELAAWFASSVHRRSRRTLIAILKRGGYTVAFRPTAATRDVMRATVEQSVQLIRSIPQEYLTDVQGAVMRSVQTGRDLATLTREIEQKYGLTRRRAALIARDQNNKASAAMQAAQQTALGIEEGVWMHSHAGKPRPTHLANDGKRFDIKLGWFDPDPRVRMRILPGFLVNCHCTWRPVVKGFS